MLTQALLFIVDTLFGFLTLALLLRFYMQVFRVSFNNPFGAFIVQFTNWLVKPLRKVLPSVLGLDLATLLPAYLLQLLLLVTVFALRGGFELVAAEEALLLFFWQALVATARLSVYLLIGALVLQAVLSWVNPRSPLASPLAQLTRPFLAPLRRVIPPVANIDLSPLVVILLAQLVLIFLR